MPDYSKVYYVTISIEGREDECDDGGEIEANTAADAAREYLLEFLYYGGLSITDVDNGQIEVEDTSDTSLSTFEIQGHEIVPVESSL